MFKRAMLLIMVLGILTPGALADNVFTLRMSDGPTVIAGQTVAILATIINTGAAPMVIDGSMIRATLTPRENVSGSGELDSLDPLRFTLGDFATQFNGLTLAPGQEFTFTFGTMNFNPIGATSNVSYSYYFAIGSYPTKEEMAITARAWKGNEVSFTPEVDFHSRAGLPEPLTLILLPLGLAGLIVLKKRWTTIR